MVDSIKPSVGTLSTNRNPYSAKAARGVESQGDEKHSKKPIWDKVERRKQGDRRRQSKGNYANFDMRRNPGRRKTDRKYPTIETKV